VFEGVLLRGGGSHGSGAAEPRNGAGAEVMEQIDPLFFLSVMISAVLLLCLPLGAGSLGPLGFGCRRSLQRFCGDKRCEL
jgi:hypothetical protein